MYDAVFLSVDKLGFGQAEIQNVNGCVYDAVVLSVDKRGFGQAEIQNVNGCVYDAVALSVDKRGFGQAEISVRLETVGRYHAIRDFCVSLRRSSVRPPFDRQRRVRVAFREVRLSTSQVPISQLLEQCKSTTIHEHQFREPEAGQRYCAALLTYSQPENNGGFLYQITGKKQTAVKIISVIKEAAHSGSGTSS